MNIEVEVRHRLGDFRLDARFVSDNGLIALFGKSGSGKTSLINVIGGLIRPEHGRVAIDGTTLVDTARGIFIPMHRRRVGYVFQEGRLFPHLSVRRNLLYGRWFAPKEDRREDLDRVVEMLGIGHLLDRRPSGLSGGEKQRVAIGRALLAEPRLLLMDEPLASLDEDRKAEIMPYIERLRDQALVPIVYVSHSLAEVARLATTIVAMVDGRVTACGPAADIIRRADLDTPGAFAEAGSLIETIVERHDDDLELTLLSSRAGEWRVPRLDLPAGTRLRLLVRARDVMLSTVRPEKLSALNILPGTVAEILEAGSQVDVRVACGEDFIVARLTRQSARSLDLKPDRSVYAIVKAVAFDRQSLGRPLRVRLPAVDAT